MSQQPTETADDNRTTVKLNMPAPELERIKAHAAKVGIETEAGAVRYAALCGLGMLDAHVADKSTDKSVPVADPR